MVHVWIAVLTHIFKHVCFFVINFILSVGLKIFILPIFIVYVSFKTNMSAREKFFDISQKSPKENIANPVPIRAVLNEAQNNLNPSAFCRTISYNTLLRQADWKLEADFPLGAIHYLLGSWLF